MALDPSVIDQIIKVESGGNPTAANPNSSATGLGQFIGPTWLDMMGRYRPDLVEGKSPEQILALRNDPAISREMTGNYAQENADRLSSAGLPATPGSIYLSHFSGPKGAASVLGADPTSPIETILGPKVVAANPFMRGMSAGDLVNWAEKKMGGAGSQTPAVQPQIQQQPTPLSAQSVASAPVSPLPLYTQPTPQTSQQAPQQAADSAQGFWGSLPADQGTMRPPDLPMPPQRRNPFGPFQFNPGQRRGFALRG